MTNNKLPLNKLYVILSLLGFTLVSTLIISLTQLYQLVDSSPRTNSMVISFIILSLFIGMYLGHRFNKNIQKKLKWTLIIAAMGITIFLSQFFIAGFFPLFSQYISSVQWLATLIFVLCFSLLYLLQAQAISLVFHRLTHGEVIREYFSAGLFCLALGCLVGTMVTLLVTTDYLNLNWGVFINVCLILLAAIILIENYVHDMIKLSLMLSILLLCYAANIQANARSYIQAMQTAPAVSFQSMVNLLQQNKHNYLNQTNSTALLQQFLFKDLKLQRQNILILGGGGERFKQLESSAAANNHFTYMNFNVADELSACNYLNTLTRGDRVYHHSNSAAFKKQYSVIVSNRVMENQQQLSYQYLQSINHALTPKGVAIFNLNLVAQASDTGNNYKTGVINKAIRTIFPGCVNMALQNDEKFGNKLQLIYICQKPA